MKKLVVLVLLFSVFALPIFAEDTATPARAEERTCKNNSCTCSPCECDPCGCQFDEEIACCDKDNCPHGDNNDDHKNNK